VLAFSIQPTIDTATADKTSQGRSSILVVPRGIAWVVSRFRNRIVDVASIVPATSGPTPKELIRLACPKGRCEAF
jgi:hypothetical protein